MEFAFHLSMKVIIFYLMCDYKQLDKRSNLPIDKMKVICV